jgi:hypothetical protein
MAIEFGWSYANVSTKNERIPNTDIVFFLNARITSANLPKEYIGIHIVRDPRDILVSGYLYHKRTIEPWCTNKNHRIGKEIEYPQIPYSQLHRSFEWKRKYLDSLGGMSYQDVLNNCNATEGLLFELAHYCAWTLEDIRESQIDDAKILEVRFEDLMDDFENWMQKVFEHCKLTGEERKFAELESSKENLKKMSDRDLRKNTHIASKRTSKWKEYFDEGLKEKFENLYGDIIRRYGYE